MAKSDGNVPDELMENDYLRFLNLGFHVAPTADQDNHYHTWGSVTDARTGVITDELTKSKVMDALRARHVYATEDKNLRIIFRVNGALCGDRSTSTPVPNSQLQIEFSIKDDDEPDADYLIDVFSGAAPGSGPAAVVNTVQVHGDTTAGRIEDVRYNGGRQYVFFRVAKVAEDGRTDRAWTAPVWFEPSGSGAPSANETASDATLVASRNSRIFHVSPDCISAQAIKPENRITGTPAKVGRNKHEGCPLRGSH
jgi:hypothetical protein